MLEIACFNPSSAITAAKSGADRIELCADYAVGGITPPVEWLSDIRKETDLPVNVMIRPRGGNFVYNGEEFEKMREDITQFKSTVSGFVFGILDSAYGVDTKRNRDLVELAAPLPCTFHRAIDETRDIDTSIGHVIDCGFKSILTSGGKKNAVQGAQRVANLQKEFGQRISIIIGGGIRSSNLEEVREITHVSCFHSAAITQVGESVDSEEISKMQLMLAHVRG